MLHTPPFKARPIPTARQTDDCRFFASWFGALVILHHPAIFDVESTAYGIGAALFGVSKGVALGTPIPLTL